MTNIYLIIIYIQLLMLTHAIVLFSIYGPPFSEQARYAKKHDRILTLISRLSFSTALVTKMNMILMLSLLRNNERDTNRDIFGSLTKLFGA